MPSEKDQFVLKVNGDEIVIQHRYVVAHDILELAEKHDIITEPPDHYVLKSLILDDRTYGWEEEVDLEKDNQFVTIRNAPTPVA